MRHGTTLLELVVALLLMGAVTGLAVPPLGHLRDRALVLEARERLVAAIREARAASVERGGAVLSLSGRPPLAILLSGADTLRVERWAPPVTNEYGGSAPAAVDLVVGRGAEAARLSFDAAGIGRFASLTVSFTRGEARAEVVVSSYGRVRRR